MNVLLKFRSRIITEETYPHSVSIEFACEAHDSEDIWKEAHEFETSIIKGRIVDTTTECLGILQIRNAKTSEALDLARLGLETI